jgi:eukaryotic-like serine/threonine-protein kinase
MCLNPGDILAERYKIIDRLGQGGFARTYTAQDLENLENPPCVIKEIAFPESNNSLVLEQGRRRFQREAKALRILGKDSRIPKLFDRFEENDHFYLVQEFIEGTPLSQELSQGQQWTEASVIAFLQEILEILIFVHQADVIHRDITPSNLIRRTNDRKIVLIDFGAVKEIRTLTSNSTGEILTSEPIGTTGYMPAEQYRARLTPQPYNDIYTVGIVAIQALTGRHPRNLPHDSDTGEVIWDYSTFDRGMLQVSDGLKNILNQMVRYHFQERYQSATEVLEALNSLYLPKSNELLPPNKLSRPKHKLDRSNLRWLLLRFLGVGAALAIVYFIFRSLQQPIPVSSPPAPINPLVSCLDSVSSGEKALLEEKPIRSKQRGIDAFAKSNYPEAFDLFKQSWQKDGRDPETLIYMNNSLLMATKAEYYTIAIVVPTRRNQDGTIANAGLAKEQLRGIAQAQTEVNLSILTSRDRERDFPGQQFLEPKPMNGKGLKVIVADDKNIIPEAIKRASCLVTKPDILAVIGHNSSDLTVETVDIYNDNKLVAISPGSSTEELTQKPRKFFFRTAPTASIEAELLVSQLRKENQKIAIGFYNHNSAFSASLWDEFKNKFKDSGESADQISEFYQLSKKDFNAEQAIKEVNKKGKTALVIIPDAQVTNSLENAIEMIKANNDRHWIVSPWTLYDRKTLEAAKQLSSVEKLAISVFWHPLTSFDKKFPENAKKLWVGQVNTRSALTYDASRALIKALEMQPQPTREGIQKTLANPNFKAEGASGIIEFDSKTGNRKNFTKGLVHIVPCRTQEFELTFVPIEFPTAAAAGLKCE